MCRSFEIRGMMRIICTLHQFTSVAKNFLFLSTINVVIMRILSCLWYFISDSLWNWWRTVSNYTLLINFFPSWARPSLLLGISRLVVHITKIAFIEVIGPMYFVFMRYSNNWKIPLSHPTPARKNLFPIIPLPTCLLLPTCPLALPTCHLLGQFHWLLRAHVYILLKFLSR